jgi:hypothetical protein
MKKRSLASYLKTTALVFIFSLSVQSAFAQDGFDDDVDDEAPQTFIDGFVVVGIMAGAVYGMKKLKKEEQ